MNLERYQQKIDALKTFARLGYFGQTVNIAARVQGLAKSEEIWLSNQVFESKSVAPTLTENG